MFQDKYVFAQLTAFLNRTQLTTTFAQLQKAGYTVTPCK